MIELESLCAKLKELRQQSGLLQSELCDRTRLSQATISNIESGKNFNIDAFITLYNFYVEIFDSNVVVGKLFDVTDAYTSVILEKLKMLSKKHQENINDIIDLLE